MPRQRKRPVEGLTFLVTTDPNNEAAAANKKRVRSIAAQKSWSGRRKRIRHEAAPDDDQAVPAEDGDNNNDAASTPPSVASARRLKRKGSHGSETRKKECPPRELLDSHIRAESSSQRADLLVPTQPHPICLAGCNQPVCMHNIRFAMMPNTRDSSVSYALITPPNTPPPFESFAHEPFNCAPIPHKAWHDEILHHMMTVFAPRGWPALKITHQEGIKWERFMTQHALADPALYYVRLLFASGDLVRLGALDRRKALWLQNKAIESIKEALRDPKRATSDPLILAVGRIALHESMYGDRSAANALHRPAQQRMIQLRGGMGALDFPELVKRLMRWADKVMSIQSGTSRMLEDDTDNPNYTLAQSVQVLEEWVPREGKSLRSKISIADLMNKVDAT